MKRFARALAGFLTLQVVLFLGAAAVFYRPDRESYLGASILKHTRLAQAPSPRVIFVGASNLPFTLNSEVIERETGYHPINMGLGQALGLKFNLAEVKPYLRPGDVVVLSFPYEWFSGEKPDTDVVLRTLEIQPRLLWRMSWLDLGEILQRDWVFEYLGRVVRTIVRTAAGRRPPPDGPFRVDAFNRFGDVVAHWSRPVPERRRSTIDLGPDYVVQNNEVLRRFAEFVAARGGRVLYLFPAMPEGIFEDPHARQFIDRVETELTRTVGIQALNRPAEFAMPFERFFDTAYHLTGPAVQIFSSRVAATLRVALSGMPPGERPSAARR
jgi:hypothetical protein